MIRAALIALLLAGCAPLPDRGPVNPSFAVSIATARQILHYDAAHRRPLRRPLLIVGGFGDPGYAPPILHDRFGRYTGDRRIADVSIGLDLSWAQCRHDIVAAADAAFPTADPDQTTEVDVVGISMGGLAARDAALSDPTHSHRRLRIARLFTISSPLRGALLAELTPFDVHPLQADMRAGSAFYRVVNNWPQRPADLYAVYSYVRLRDGTVGVGNAAVPGVTPWWVSTPPLEPPHDASLFDPRILADIAARLRGDRPLAHDPPARLPSGS